MPEGPHSPGLCSCEPVVDQDWQTDSGEQLWVQRREHEVGVGQVGNAKHSISSQGMPTVRTDHSHLVDVRPLVRDNDLIELGLESDVPFSENASADSQRGRVALGKPRRQDAAFASLA